MDGNGNASLLQAQTGQQVAVQPVTTIQPVVPQQVIQQPVAQQQTVQPQPQVPVQQNTTQQPMQAVNQAPAPAGSDISTSDLTQEVETDK